MYEKSDVISGVFEKIIDGYYIFSSLTNGRGQLYYGKVFYLKATSIKYSFQVKCLYSLKFSIPQLIGAKNEKAKVLRLFDCTNVNWDKKNKI